ncbi:helix-turn-helix domain-containing protein [Nocardioidaceae bacterium SCSIO 66511]|nr:helix-turn-helix domain-containing protein [Nocardioidaceae bacterium SCSIO 66511]
MNTMTDTDPTPHSSHSPGWRAPQETHTSPDTLLLNLNEVAEQLRCMRRSVERYIAARRLFALHIGRSVRVERRELEEFIQRMRARETRYGQTA